ncbi:hypothetical protein MKX01_033830, partial [Papaver californicum]
SEDIRNSGKKLKDFVWIPYPYTRSEKLLWIEVPSKGFYDFDMYASDSENEVCGDCTNGDHKLFLDGEAYNANPYRCLPPKGKDYPLDHFTLVFCTGKFFNFLKILVNIKIINQLK